MLLNSDVANKTVPTSKGESCAGLFSDYRSGKPAVPICPVTW